MPIIMDGVRNELPKLGQDTRFLLENQRQQRDRILKETEEYEQRAEYLKNKIKEIEDKVFKTSIGAKIKELVKENLNLSIDAQCLSIELDIQNQMDNRGVSENNFYRNSPSILSNPGHPIGNQANIMNRVHTPTTSQNVVTLDTSTYPYAQVVSPNVGNMSPYPIQPGLPTLPYPMSGNRHLSPHHDPQRQHSLSPGHNVHPNIPFYQYNRQGSLSILNQVPPPAPIHPPSGWMQPGNYPMSPANPGPPVPPRPSDLPLRNPQGRNLSTTSPHHPHRPVPPPPTPPKPNNAPSRSPNMERPRSSNDIIDHREEDENLVWECTACTFQNHSAMNVCEICGNSRIGSLGTINRSPN